MLAEKLLMRANQSGSCFSNGIDVLSKYSGMVSALALLAMISMICLEVLSRWLFNEPTVWVSEYSTYFLIALTFIGLAYAQKEKCHIKVELLLGYMSDLMRRKLNVLTLWIGLFFVVFATWQTIAFNWQEYANNTRKLGPARDTPMEAAISGFDRLYPVLSVLAGGP